MPSTSSTAAAPSQDHLEKADAFAGTVRALRQKGGMTLQELSKRSGLATSTISKIERAQLSPTYDTILSLADGLGIDMTELFNRESGATNMASGRRSVTRGGHGTSHSSPQYEYEIFCADLLRKQFIPMVARVTARSLDAFPRLSRHDGEEFIYVISGSIELHTEHYEPTRLETGDGCYLDSAMGHACISVSKDDAMILWINSRGEELTRASLKSPSGPHSTPR